MTEKFSIEDLIIKVMPGGFLLAIVYFLFGNKIQLTFVDNLDFFYTFLFFCSAFIVGELLQTIAHEIEWIIDIFFKFRRPSEVFLYKNNPILKNNHQRDEIMQQLALKDDKAKNFDKDYSKLSILWWKKDKESNELSQSVFWKLYSRVSDIEEIKTANRNYLFVRVITIEFLLIATLLLSDKNYFWAITSTLFCLIFLWRSRGIARGLVFKTVLLNLKDK